MKIKHSKFKNTGLLYELLVKQITSDLVARKESPAVNILRKYFSGNSPLVQEYGLYKLVTEKVNQTTVKADSIIGAALKAAKKLDQKELGNLKYSLISEIKANYQIEDFFNASVANYKPLAAFYCLLEAERSQDLIDPESIVNNKVTLLEHMTSRQQSQEDVRDRLIQEFSSQEKDLRLLTFKILLEKFNQKYANLLPEQKNILQHIVSIGSNRELREFLNEEMNGISKKLVDFSKTFPKSIEKIKLNEAIKILEPIPSTEKVTDDKLYKVLQFYDLLEELKRV